MDERKATVDGKVRELVKQPGADGGPVWSPDGRTIAFGSSMSKQYSFLNSGIGVVPAAGGTIEYITKAFDENPNLVDWPKAGLFFSASQKTASALFRAYIDGNELAWRATHYDLLIGQARADQIRAYNPHARIFDYVNTRYLTLDVAAYVWAQAHGYDNEDFYLHYKEDTAVPTWESTVIVPGFPPGIVPGYNPGGGGNPASATTRSQSRVPGFASASGMPGYQATSKERSSQNVRICATSAVSNRPFFTSSVAVFQSWIMTN